MPATNGVFCFALSAKPEESGDKDGDEIGAVSGAGTACQWLTRSKDPGVVKKIELQKKL